MAISSVILKTSSGVEFWADELAVREFDKGFSVEIEVVQPSTNPIPARATPLLILSQSSGGMMRDSATVILPNKLAFVVLFSGESNCLMTEKPSSVEKPNRSSVYSVPTASIRSLDKPDEEKRSLSPPNTKFPVSFGVSGLLKSNVKVCVLLMGRTNDVAIARGKSPWGSEPRSLAPF